MVDISSSHQQHSEISAADAAACTSNSSVAAESCLPRASPSDQGKDSFFESGEMSQETVIPTEYTCILCLRLYYEPVSLSCGHTFCRGCLRRALVFKPQCPMCRAACLATAGECSTNLALVDIIKSRFGQEYVDRAKEAEQDAIDEAGARRRAAMLGESVTPAPDGSVCMPVCLLDVLLFPDQPVTLYLFEPRYITLVNRCLSDTRRFAVFSDSSPAEGAAGSILEISDARMMGRGHYLVLCRGVGRCISLGEFEIEEGTSGLRYARVAPFEDEEEAAGDVAMGEDRESGAGGAGRSAARTADEVLGTELRELADRTAAIVSRFISQLSTPQKEDLIRRYGELPKVGNSFLSSYRKLSFWLASALSLGNNASTGNTWNRSAGQAASNTGGNLVTTGRAEVSERERRAALFKSRSLKQRLAETCEVVMASDAVRGSTNRRRERGLRRLFCVNGSGGRPKSTMNSILLVVGIVTALWAYRRFSSS